MQKVCLSAYILVFSFSSSSFLFLLGGGEERDEWFGLITG
uniref:Uncharacterized protein n=1 Tax=Rhizophora mucronata TaxID=61149 RepID=A0A2P2P5L8_RHIMU